MPPRPSFTLPPHLALIFSETLISSWTSHRPSLHPFLSFFSHSPLSHWTCRVWYQSSEVQRVDQQVLWLPCLTSDSTTTFSILATFFLNKILQHPSKDQV